MLAENQAEALMQQVNFRGKIRAYHSTLSIIHKASDALWIATALWLCCHYYGLSWSLYCSTAAACAVGLFYFFAEINNLYRSWRCAPFGEEIGRVWAAWLGALLGLLLIAYLSGVMEHYTRSGVITWFVLAPLVLTGWRFCIRQTLRVVRVHGYNSRTVAIAGAGALGRQVAETIIGSPWMGMRVVGFYDDRKVGRDASAKPPAPVKGDFEALVEFARAGKVDVIYVALSAHTGKRIQELIDALRDTTASVYFVPDLFVLNLLHARWISLDGIPAISVFENPFLGLDGWLKRAEDLVVSTIILTLIAMPMLVIAVGVKLSSPGPVFFRQRRYGLDGREIVVWKFRSMRVCEDGVHITQATKGDPRVTCFGAFLRRTSLDELPQFINVLQGRMSIVGPRPHAVAHNEQYRKLIPGYMLRHKVKPGITGLAQVNGWRGETDTLDKMQKRIEYDLEYIRTWSLGLDIKIILKTFVHGFAGHNAY